MLRITDDGLVLDRGAIVHAGPSQRLLDDPSILERHMGVARGREKVVRLGHARILAPSAHQALQPRRHAARDARLALAGQEGGESLRDQRQLLAAPMHHVPAAQHREVHDVQDRKLARLHPQADGVGGPVNRFALDVINFGPAVEGSTLECVYPGKFRYRCPYTFPAVQLEDSQTRVEVLVPDLDRGPHVVLRLVNRFGSSDFPVELNNPPRLVHQIVATALAGGGVVASGPDGQPAPVLSLITERTDTVASLAVTLPYDPAACDRLYALWSQASATDPVFTSQFGPLSGTVLLLQPVVSRTPLTTNSPMHWQLTYAASATRVQFIAHLEVFYRVGVCRERILTG